MRDPYEGIVEIAETPSLRATNHLLAGGYRFLGFEATSKPMASGAQRRITYVLGRTADVERIALTHRLMDELYGREGDAGEDTR